MRRVQCCLRSQAIKEATLNEETKLEGMSYREVVDSWAQERELLGEVQPYTARKSAQKALLFAPAFGEGDVRQLDAQDVTGALIELARHGGRKGSGLSSTTLRAAHLAGTQALNWAIAKGLVATNPFAEVRRPREERGQA